MLDGAKMTDDLWAWFRSGTTGASAEAIADFLTENKVGEFKSYPLDGSDFDRCERLLTMVPDLRPLFEKEMGKANDYWAVLVPAWDKIKGSVDRRAVIKTLVGQIQDNDPAHFDFGKNAHIRVDNYVGEKPKSPPMKETAADKEVRDSTLRVAAGELRQFIERLERLDAEKRDIADQQKEVMAEAKGRGYDVRAIRKIIAERKRDVNDLAEEQAVLDLYRDALGM